MSPRKPSEAPKPSATEDENVICSFCGRQRNNVQLMYVGMGGAICDECILDIMAILIDNAAQNEG